MSRSGYSEDYGDDEPGLINLYRGSVTRAIRGKRGQAFLREMAAALDAMPIRELIAGDVVNPEGQVCAIGSVALARGVDVKDVDINDGDEVGKVFGVARSLACEIAFVNDDDFGRSENETPGERWKRVRQWVGSALLSVPIVEDFLSGVFAEKTHQLKRWGTGSIRRLNDP